MDWIPDWSEEVVAIVASGPSITKEEVAKLQGRCKVAVVNNNYKFAPWADLLYAADGSWWSIYKDAKDFAGLKITSNLAAARDYKLNLINLFGVIDTDDDRIIFGPKGTVGRGGNSGFQIINLVCQTGCKKQIWMGFDFCGSHWHEDHPRPLKNPQARTLLKWRLRLEAQSGLLIAAGIDVVVVSAISELTSYKKVANVEDALKEFQS